MADVPVPALEPVPDQARTNVIDPSGEVVSLPQDQLAEAINNRGYQVATPDQVDQHFKEEKFSTPGQQVAAAVEGVGEGIAGPAFTYLEKKSGLTTPENMLARREANPGLHGLGQGLGFIGSSLTGVGEGALLEKAGAGVAKGLGLSKPVSAIAKITAGGARASTEMALMQAGDETSKMLMNDPNASLQTATVNVGLSALLGAGGGAALGAVSPLWKATAGEKLGQFVEDFKGRINQHLENPDPAGMLRNELDNYYKGITGMADEVYGAQGLKEQEIQKLMPAMHEGITEQTQKISGLLDGALKDLSDDPFVGKLQKVVEKYQETIAKPIWNGETRAGEVFSATQKLKQQLQEWGKFNKNLVPLAEREFRDTAKNLSFELRTSLEDSGVWGKAAERQQAINGAFKEYLPALKDFEAKFTSSLGEDRVIDPGKINTYVNQLGKPNAELKQEMLQRFLDASEKYRGVVEKTHKNLGLEGAFQPTSLQGSKASLQRITPGAKAADALINRGLAGVAGKGIGTAIGAGIGSLTGHGWLGALIGEHALGPFFTTILPSLAKPLLTGVADGEALKSAVDYGLAVTRGEKILSAAAKNVFKPGAEVLGRNLIPDDKSRKKLEKRLEEIGKNPEEVLQKTNKYGTYFPNHSGAHGATMGAAYEYLNAVKPKARKVTLLDKEIKPSAHEKAEYNKVLDLAEQPAMIFDKIKDGTITSRDLAVIKNIYPAFYQRSIMKLHDELVAHIAKEQTVPYQTRVGLAKFFGEPLDSTMQPMGMASIQQSLLSPESSQPTAGQVMGNKIQALQKSADLMQTQQQASESRKQSMS